MAQQYDDKRSFYTVSSGGKIAPLPLMQVTFSLLNAVQWLSGTVYRACLKPHPRDCTATTLFSR